MPQRPYCSPGWPGELGPARLAIMRGIFGGRLRDPAAAWGEQQKGRAAGRGGPRGRVAGGGGGRGEGRRRDRGGGGGSRSRGSRVQRDDEAARGRQGPWAARTKSWPLATCSATTPASCPKAAYGGPRTAGRRGGPWRRSVLQLVVGARQARRLGAGRGGGAVEALRPPGRAPGAGQGGHGYDVGVARLDGVPGDGRATGPWRDRRGRMQDDDVRRRGAAAGAEREGGEKEGRRSHERRPWAGRPPAGAGSAGGIRSACDNSGDIEAGWSQEGGPQGAFAPPGTTAGTWALGPACRAVPASSRSESWTGSRLATCPTTADAPSCSADTPAAGAALPATAPAHNPGRGSGHTGGRRRNVHPNNRGQRGGPVRGNLQVVSRLGQGHDAGSMQGRR